MIPYLLLDGYDSSYRNTVSKYHTILGTVCSVQLDPGSTRLEWYRTVSNFEIQCPVQYSMIALPYSIGKLLRAKQLRVSDFAHIVSIHLMYIVDCRDNKLKYSLFTTGRRTEDKVRQKGTRRDRRRLAAIFDTKITRTRR